MAREKGQTRRSSTDVSPAEIQEHLTGVDYPVKKDELIDHAKGKGASDDVVSILQQLPSKTYNSPVDVTKAVGDIE